LRKVRNKITKRVVKMTREKINQMEVLRELVNAACDNFCFENTGINKEINNLYGVLIDIMEEMCTREQKEVLHAIDDMVSSMLCSYYNNGVVSGMELVSAVRELTSKPSNIYKELLTSKSVTDGPYTIACSIAEKYQNILNKSDCTH